MQGRRWVYRHLPSSFPIKIFLTTILVNNHHILSQIIHTEQWRLLRANTPCTCSKLSIFTPNSTIHSHAIKSTHPHRTAGLLGPNSLHIQIKEWNILLTTKQPLHSSYNTIFLTHMLCKLKFIRLSRKTQPYKASKLVRYSKLIFF